MFNEFIDVVSHLKGQIRPEFFFVIFTMFDEFMYKGVLYQGEAIDLRGESISIFTCFMH